MMYKKNSWEGRKEINKTEIGWIETINNDFFFKARNNFKITYAYFVP